MGAPTSPVLSNFACIELDTELVALCRNMGLTYTRYADDLSFSGVNDISPEDKELIEDTIKAHRFIINPDKVRLFAEGEIKTITGLQIRDGQVKLPEKYYHLLRLEINRLQHTKEVENRYHTGMSQKKLKLMEQEIMGKLNFARMVPGELEIKEELEFQFAKALEPPDEAESANWLDFPYIF